MSDTPKTTPDVRITLPDGSPFPSRPATEEELRRSQEILAEHGPQTTRWFCSACARWVIVSGLPAAFCDACGLTVCKQVPLESAIERALESRKYRNAQR